MNENMPQSVRPAAAETADRSRIGEYDVTKLLRPFLDVVKAEGRILDLGAGTGLQANKFAEHGMKITAVDILDAPSDLREGVEWLKQPLEDFIASLRPEQKFDGVYLQNIIHFFPKEFIVKTLLPLLRQHLSDEGVIGIETMSAPPEPVLKKFILFYSPDELAEIMEGEVLLSEKEDTKRLEVDGSFRIFHHTRVIVRKSSKIL